jgi:hypothetical protein
VSESSYQQNRSLGVTGPHTLTCEAAAFERLSLRPVASRTNELYNQWGRTAAALGHRVLSDPMARAQALDSGTTALGALCGDLGIDTSDVVRSRAKTPDELRYMLNGLATAKRRTALVLDMGPYLHAVGISSVVEDYCTLTGTWTPVDGDEPELGRERPVHMETVFPMLNQRQPDAFSLLATGARTVTNVISLPPEVPPAVSECSAQTAAERKKV